MDEKRGRGRPKKINPGADFLFDSPDNPEMEDVGLEHEQPNLDPKQWRSFTNKQKAVQADPRVGEDLRLNLALQKYPPHFIWALQAYTIIKNPEMLYRCTHTIRDTDTRSGIIKKATTFLNNDDVKLILEWSEKNFLDKEHFMPLEVKKALLEKKEDDYVQGILDENGEVPEMTKDEMIDLYTKRLRLDPKDDVAGQRLIELRQWKKLEEAQEEDIFTKCVHYAVHRDCQNCEFKKELMCKGCFIDRLADNDCTDEELTWYENYMKDD